jgi:hypothetical protein
MHHPSTTALFTTASGIVGGVSKAISAKPLLLAITFHGLTTVVIYAAASAAVGYVVKKAMDAISKKLEEFVDKYNDKGDE